MPPNVIYGDSFGDLTRNELAAAQMRQRGLEFALAGATRQLEGMKQRSILQDQFAKSMALQKEKADEERELAWSRINQTNRYYDWLMTQDSKTKAASTQHEDSFLYALGERGELGSEDEAAEIAPGSSIAGRRSAVALAKSVQGAQEQEFRRGSSLAALLNKKAALENHIANATTENQQSKEGHWYMPWRGGGDDDIIKQNDEAIKAWTAELGGIRQAIEPYEKSKILDRYVRPSANPAAPYESAVEAPYHLRPRGRGAPTSTGNAPIPMSNVPNRRSYGAGVTARGPNFTLNQGKTPNAPPVPVQDAGAAGMITNAPTPQVQDPAAAAMVTNTATGTTAAVAANPAASWRARVVARAKELVAAGTVKTADEGITRAMTEIPR